jgi:hypothetical protein
MRYVNLALANLNFTLAGVNLVTGNLPLVALNVFCGTLCSVVLIYTEFKPTAVTVKGDENGI